MPDVRVSAQTAGYMELDGARKDGDCYLVQVKGGVSFMLGCCNLFNPDKAKQFQCGSCTHRNGATTAKPQLVSMPQGDNDGDERPSGIGARLMARGRR
jgi:hypothetical protein